jgi:hypothetical protein
MLALYVESICTLVELSKMAEMDRNTFNSIQRLPCGRRMD